MTTVEDIVKLFTNPDRVRIMKDDKEIFVGYLYSLTTEEMAEYRFSDLQMSLYYTIHI